MICASHPSKEDARKEDRESSEIGDRDEMCEREEYTTDERTRHVKRDPEYSTISPDKSIETTLQITTIKDLFRETH